MEKIITKKALTRRLDHLKYLHKLSLDKAIEETSESITNLFVNQAKRLEDEIRELNKVLKPNKKGANK